MLTQLLACTSLMLIAGLLCAQVAPDHPAWPALDKGYACLHVEDWECAVRNFSEAVAKAPAEPSIHKQLGYTLLKIGETEKAREAVREAVALDPSDYHVALEYAFLAYETSQRAAALAIFRRVAEQASGEVQLTARKTYDRLDQALQTQIERWKHAAQMRPDDFSAHHELALLAEESGDLELSLEHLRESWRIRPDLRTLLIDQARVLQALGYQDAAQIALFAASRAPEPRVADRARQLLRMEHPTLTEYEKALGLDPENFLLRREFAGALEAAGRDEEAKAQREVIYHLQPKDLVAAAQLGRLLLQENREAEATVLLERVIEEGDEILSERARRWLGRPPFRVSAPTPESGQELPAREMGFVSYQKGYLRDARKYLEQAVAENAEDYAAALKLAWTYNGLKNDQEAVRWFAYAIESKDEEIAEEARKAYRSLTAEKPFVTSTVWALPMYSTRWKNAFTYSQAKAELTRSALPFIPYLSLRFIGDIGQKPGGPLPQYLSETAFIPGAGVRTGYWRGLLGWAEAGLAVSYLRRRDGTDRLTPDYRAGLTWAKAQGRLIGSTRAGPFQELNADAVWVSRFDRDTLFYIQHRNGYTPARSDRLGGMLWQIYWNTNVTWDAKRQYWANFLEIGPGIAIRWRSWPPALRFSINALRGVYLRNEGNPRRPNFYDVRVGFWYAFSR